MLRTEVAGIGSISPLVFGCASAGGRVSERTSLRAMEVAFEMGITTFDIARSYGYGDAERILGKFLVGRRGRAQIITKAGIIAPRPSKLLSAAKSVARGLFAFAPGARIIARPALGRQHVGGHFDAHELEASLVTSLRALGTDHVDVLLLHACSSEVIMRDDVCAAMAGFVRRGLTRRVGVAAGANEASLWLKRGGDPSAELPALELAKFMDRDVANGLWLANQALGGGRLLERLAVACSERGLDRKLALEFLLHRPLRQGAHGAVVSMLSEGHVQLAMDAMQNPLLQPHEIDELERAVQTCHAPQSFELG